MCACACACVCVRPLVVSRLPSQLDPDQLEYELLAQLPGPAWVPEAKRVTPIMYLRKLAAKRLEIEPADVTREQLDEANTLPNRMRYLLAETMGADGELERRAAELELIAQAGGSVSLLTKGPQTLPVRCRADAHASAPATSGGCLLYTSPSPRDS